MDVQGDLVDDLAVLEPFDQPLRDQAFHAVTPCRLARYSSRATIDESGCDEECTTHDDPIPIPERPEHFDGCRSSTIHPARRNLISSSGSRSQPLQGFAHPTRKSTALQCGFGAPFAAEGLGTLFALPVDGAI